MKKLSQITPLILLSVVLLFASCDKTEIVEEVKYSSTPDMSCTTGINYVADLGVLELEGTAKITGNDYSSYKAFFYLLDGKKTYEEVKKQGKKYAAGTVSADGTFSLTIDNLEWGQIYSFIASIEKGNDWADGKVQTGRTENIGMSSTGGIIELTEFSATIKCYSTLHDPSDPKVGDVGIHVYVITSSGPSKIFSYGSREILNNDRSYTIEVSFLKGGTKYCYQAYTLLYANAQQTGGPEEVKGKMKEFETKPLKYVANAVDLGLPSGLKWADTNLGTDVDWHSGGFFTWGDPTPSNANALAWRDYKFGGPKDSTLTKYCITARFGPVDNKLVLDSEDDPASVLLGHGWRTPTKEETEELINKCTWSIEQSHGITIFKATGPNGKSIRIPAAGDAPEDETNGVGARILTNEQVHMWTSTLFCKLTGYNPVSDICHSGWTFSAGMKGASPSDGMSSGLGCRPRESCMPIRPVHP
ncbi:MAG: hypothetical protein IK076_00335 [Bacteroidales bacterium]|nr:hypothetical protein [Bacteroidales bacterium]